MKYIMALAGNPNCGKTTLFNELTGSNQHVGNWPGVTVDKKEGKYKRDKEISILDLPGTYSLSPYSAEEVVARNYIVNEKPDIVIDIVDGTSIERNLYLTLQILETRIPTIIALNMMDEVEARGDKIDIQKLSSILGVKVIPISARNAKGVKELMEAAAEVARNKEKPAPLDIFDENIAATISKIKAFVEAKDEDEKAWKAIKLAEGDEVIVEELNSENKLIVDEIVKEAEKDADGDVEAKIADLRYRFIAKVVKQTVKKKNTGHVETNSDKIDKILTNRFLSIPIFAVVMYLLFEITFGSTIIGIGPILQGWVTGFWDGPLTETVVNVLVNLGASDWALSLVQDGILAGVGGVISFLPQILLLFILMSVLEDSGYMARVAFVMDRIFRKFGLSGKSFIPLLMGFGCGVPAIMASRTLDSEKDRRLTIMITTFMSCGAKLPIYLMFGAALFADSNQTLITFTVYMIGMVTAVVSAIILNKLVFKSETSNFVMELPQYRLPTAKSVALHGLEKVKGYVIKAGTIILTSTILIWFLSSFNFTGMVDMEDSILASIGNAFKFIFAPLGFGNWRAAVGTITGFIAKENIVATFGVLFGASDDVISAAQEGSAALPGIADIFTHAAAWSYMVFNLLCMPCFAAVGAIRREMGSWKWTLRTIGFQMITAWIVAFIVYHIALIFS